MSCTDDLDHTHTDLETDLETAGQKYNRLAASDKTKDNVLLAMEPDFITPGTNRFAVLSFINSDQYNMLKTGGSLSHPAHLIKVRGTFATAEDAQRHAKEVLLMDPHFDVHVIEMFKWTTIGASVKGEEHYPNKMVDSLMRDYLEKQEETLEDIQARQKIAKEQFSTVDNIFEQADLGKKVATEVMNQTKEEILPNLKRMSVGDFVNSQQTTIDTN